jgi:Big-like domain-containing protein
MREEGTRCVTNRHMTGRFWAAFALTLVALATGCSSDDTPSTPTSATPPAAAAPPPPTLTSVTLAGTQSFTARGTQAQFALTASYSDGSISDESRAATWSTDNSNVATVSGQGLVTSQGDGDATIAAVLSGMRATRAVSVRIPAPPPAPPPTPSPAPTTGPRTPDPAPGQRLPMPDVEAFIYARAAARPDLLAQSCPTGFKYVNNPWLDYMVDGLRTLDTRWGYNGKPTRTPADNGGNPVVAAGDEIAYHYGSGPDQGSPDVYLIDILGGHCGPTPAVTYRVFTGEEPGFWTGAGRLR